MGPAIPYKHTVGWFICKTSKIVRIRPIGFKAFI